MGNRAYLNRINKIIELQNEIKELEAVIDSLKDELKADMIKNEAEEITAGDLVLTVDLLNPLNNYCDDIIFRTDFIVKEY